MILIKKNSGFLQNTVFPPEQRSFNVLFSLAKFIFIPFFNRKVSLLDMHLCNFRRNYSRNRVGVSHFSGEATLWLFSQNGKYSTCFLQRISAQPTVLQATKSPKTQVCGAQVKFWTYFKGKHVPAHAFFLQHPPTFRQNLFGTFSLSTSQSSCF